MTSRPSTLQLRASPSRTGPTAAGSASPGSGRLAFLHGQATNDFGGSGVVEFGGSGVGPPAPGDVLPNVAFALPDGRVRDFGTAFVTADGVLLQASPWSGGRGRENKRRRRTPPRGGAGERAGQRRGSATRATSSRRSTGACSPGTRSRSPT